MNNNNGKPSRRDVVTPAQRKARQEQKNATEKNAATQKADAERRAAAENERIRQARRKEAEAARRTSAKGVNTQGRANAGTQRGSAPVSKTQPKPSERRIHEQQQQLLQQQQRIEMLQRQLREEKAAKEKTYAQKKRIHELEYKIDREAEIRRTMLENNSEKAQMYRKKNIRVIAIAAIAVLMIVNIIACSKISKSSFTPKDTVPQTVTDSGTEDTSKEQLPESIPENTVPEEPTHDTFYITSADYVQGTLALINSEHTFDFEYEGTDIKDDPLVAVASKIPDKSYKAADYKIFLCTETVDMLNIMMADFHAYSKRTDVMVNTAHRTYEQQKSILDAKTAQLGENQQIAQKPGCSEHHTGYAFDLAIYPKNENGSTFINVAPYDWIYENCHKYGFILRYPEGKTSITGIAPESWHFRYVGIPHATYMYEKGKTLEEYITDISIYSEKIPLTINTSETESYTVFYVKAENTDKVSFSIPKDTEYKISGDNAGGFIVWYNNADVGMKGKAEELTDDTAQTDTDNADLPENEAIDER